MNKLVLALAAIDRLEAQLANWRGWTWRRAALEQELDTLRELPEFALGFTPPEK